MNLRGRVFSKTVSIFSGEDHSMIKNETIIDKIRLAAAGMSTVSLGHAKNSMKLNAISLYLCIVALFSNTAFCYASSLTLTIDSSTKTYANHQQFELAVVFHNTSDKTYIVFPAYLRRTYIPLDGQHAEFKVYPGPVISPWPSAMILNPGEIKTVKYKGMSNGDGFWNLEPGRYELSVSLHIAATSYFGAVPKKYKDITVWRGHVASGKIAITYLGKHETTK